MRRRRPYFSVVFLALTLTMAVSVLAFRQAQVTNGAQITVASTDAATLAVIAVDTSVASYSNNQLQLSFPSQQPNSTYTYSDVFRVQNNTPGFITFDISSVTGEGTPTGAHLTITDSDTGTVYWTGNAASGSRLLDSSDTATMDVAIKLDSGMSLGGITLAITVRGQ